MARPVWPTRSGSSSCPKSTTVRDPRAADRPRILDVRLRPAWPAAARLRNGPTRDGSRSTWHARPTASSRTSTATTASRSVLTSTASSTPDEMIDLADLVQATGGNVNRILSGRPRGRRSTCTSSTARTTRRSAATTNAMSPPARSSSSREASRRSTTSACWPARTTTTAVERTGEGRAINRHDFTGDQVQVALDRPVVTRVVDLVRLRNTHPVFEGEVCVETDDDRSIRLRWQNGRRGTSTRRRLRGRRRCGDERWPTKRDRGVVCLTPAAAQRTYVCGRYRRRRKPNCVPTITVGFSRSLRTSAGLPDRSAQRLSLDVRTILGGSIGVDGSDGSRSPPTAPRTSAHGRRPCRGSRGGA